MSVSTRHRLTRSRLAAFEQCPRRLWLMVHEPDKAANAAGPQTHFDSAERVGALARAQYPQGIRIEPGQDVGAALAETARLMASGHDTTIFDGAFEYDGVLVRTDILTQDAEGGWQLVQVKSASSAKDHHLGDLASQLWVLEAAGLRVSRIAVRHVERTFVLREPGAYDGLLTDTAVDGPVRALAQGQAAMVEAARAVLAGPCPDIVTGPHCQTPQTCPFLDHCRAREPAGPEWPITILTHGGWRKWARQGVTDLLALDETTMSKPREAMIVAATRTGQAYHDAAGARAMMEPWAYPRAWLDFETIAALVPRWQGTRPYQQVPFQFSLHLEDADGRMTHHEFLCCDGRDPRRGCAEALVRTIPRDATVIAYNAGFERAVLRALAEQVPDCADHLHALAANTVDLLPVARQHWYHRDQRGSWSIKAVLRTMAPELDYAGLEVKDGGMAQDSFLEAIDPVTTPERRWALAEALRAYCTRDTWAMVVLARHLAGEAALSTMA